MHRLLNANKSMDDAQWGFDCNLNAMSLYINFAGNEHFCQL